MPIKSSWGCQATNKDTKTLRKKGKNYYNKICVLFWLLPTSDLSRSTADPKNDLMSCLYSLARLPGPLTEPRLNRVSAPHSAPAKLALTQRKVRGWPGTSTGSTQTAQFSSLFTFSVTPGMCLHMVEKMQQGGRSSQEHHPPYWRSALGLVACARIGSQKSWRRPWCLEQVKHWEIRWSFGGNPLLN